MERKTNRKKYMKIQGVAGISLFTKLDIATFIHILHFFFSSVPFCTLYSLSSCSLVFFAYFSCRHTLNRMPFLHWILCCTVAHSTAQYVCLLYAFVSERNIFHLFFVFVKKRDTAKLHRYEKAKLTRTSTFSTQ